MMFRFEGRPGAASLVASLLLLLLACGSEMPPSIPFEVEETSRFLCLGTEFSGMNCVANIALLDEQVDYVSSLLGAEPPEECIPTMWTENAALDCGPYQGCYTGGIVVSNWQYLPHELVHAVAGNAGLDGPLFIREGLAEALSGKVLRSNGLGLESIIEFGTSESSLSYSEYEAVGHLVAWMMDYFGVELVVELYSLLDRDMSKDKALATLESVSGVALADLKAEYALATNTVYAGKGPFACGAHASSLPWSGGRAVGDVAFSCGSGQDFQRVDLGQYLGHTEELWRGYRVDLSAGQYRFELGTTLFSYAVLEACLSGDTAVEDLPSPPEPVLRSWGELRQWGFFEWRDLPKSISVPGGIVLDLPSGMYTFWVGWVKDPSPGLLVTPETSFAIERVN